MNFLSLDYLLSNNHVNSIIVHKFDFSDEEVMAYYISFLKTLSLKLNAHTIHFFYNEVNEVYCIECFISIFMHHSFIYACFLFHYDCYIYIHYCFYKSIIFCLIMLFTAHNFIVLVFVAFCESCLLSCKNKIVYVFKRMCNSKLTHLKILPYKLD